MNAVTIAVILVAIIFGLGLALGYVVARLTGHGK